MIRKLTLTAAFGAGYVLGAKAGKERYAQIEAKFREIAGMPAVQDMTHTLVDTAGQLGDKAKSAVNDTVEAVGDKLSGGKDEVVDLAPKSSRARTGARTTSNVTAPDVPAL